MKIKNQNAWETMKAQQKGKVAYLNLMEAWADALEKRIGHVSANESVPPITDEMAEAALKESSGGAST